MDPVLVSASHAGRPGPVVYKFGGTSLGDAGRIRRVAELVAGEADRSGAPPVVVVSAVGGVTERLVELLASSREERPGLLDELEAHHRELYRTLSRRGGAPEADDADPDDAGEPGDEIGRELNSRVAGARGALPRLTDPTLAAAAADQILALGEDLSTLLLVAALEARGTRATAVDARTVVRTDARFGFARPAEQVLLELANLHLRPVQDAGRVPVLQGFVGATPDGRTTTLGRGGSDWTATLLGGALQASEVHIWTDVEGVLSGDPRHVDHPRVLAELGFEETVELAWFGAKVIHPGAAKHAVAHGVPVRIRSTFAPERPGTLILGDRMGDPDIAAVACKRDVALIKVRGRPSALPYGFLARVFAILARHQLPVDLVATSHSSTAFTVDASEETEAVARELEEVAEVEVRPGLATVTVVGSGLLREPGFDARVFGVVGHTPVHLVSQASDVSLSFVVDGESADPLVRRLHAELVAG